MGDEPVNEQGVFGGILRHLERYRLTERAGRKSPFTGYFPDGANGPARGGGLGALALSPATTRRIDCGLAFSIALDPEHTLPGSVYQVSFDRVTFYPLRLGELLPVPNGFEAFYWYNGLGHVKNMINGVAGVGVDPFSNVRFLVGRVLGLEAGWQYLQHTRSIAAVLQLAANFPTVDPNTLVAASSLPWFVTSGLSGIRISAVPTAAGVPIADPGDFALTVRPWVLVGNTFAAGNNIDPPPQSFTGATGSATWHPNSEGDIVFSSAKRTVDRQVIPGALAVTLQETAGPAGTGVAGAIVIVEGY